MNFCRILEKVLGPQLNSTRCCWTFKQKKKKDMFKNLTVAPLSASPLSSSLWRQELHWRHGRAVADAALPSHAPGPPSLVDKEGTARALPLSPPNPNPRRSPSVRRSRRHGRRTVPPPPAARG